MKDYLADRVRATANAVQGRNVAREYLQARILGTLQRVGAMMPLAFHGGTLLRFLYAIPRYSEDLDFALELRSDQYNLRSYLRAIRNDLSAEGYDFTLKVNDSKIVHSAFIRFAGLLYELGLSPHRDEVLSIRLEVDTNPPAGATLDVSIVRRYTTLRLQHHDRASLLAGKLHAILQRPYPKGRDIYDLLWYLSDPDWPAPNLTLLNNALKQTRWIAEYPTEQTWRRIVSRRVEQLPWDRVVADVRPFVESGDDVDLLSRDNVLRLLVP